MHRDLHPSSQLFLLLTCYALLCRHVRKASIQTLTMAAHNKPGLILDHLPKLLPLVYEQTKFNSALVRRVCASAAPTSLRGSALQVPSSTGAEPGHLHSMGRPGGHPRHQQGLPWVLLHYQTGLWGHNPLLFASSSRLASPRFSPADVTCTLHKTRSGPLSMPLFRLSCPNFRNLPTRTSFIAGRWTWVPSSTAWMMGWSCARRPLSAWTCCWTRARTAFSSTTSSSAWWTACRQAGLDGHLGALFASVWCLLPVSVKLSRSHSAP